MREMETERLGQLFQFLSLDPADAFTRYSIAYEYMGLEKYDKAAEHFGILIQEHPDYLGTYYHYGACLLELDKKQEAEAIFEAGMVKARDARDSHALAELQTAYNNMMYE